MTKYLDIDELAKLLGKSHATIRRNLRESPRRVPPKMHIPGTKMLRWRLVEVEIWLEEQRLPTESQVTGETKNRV